MAMTATATFRTTQEFKSRVNFLAKETRRPSSFYFNLLLEEHLEDLEEADKFARNYVNFLFGV